MNRLKINLLDVSAYIAVGAVSIPGLVTVFSQRHENRWVIAGMLFTFGFLLAVVHQTPERRQQIYAPHYFMLQTILVVSLLLLPPRLQYFNIFFFILSVDAMMLLPPRRGYLWIALFSLLTAGVFTINYGLKEAFFATPIYAGAYLFFGIFASTTARAEAAKQESQELLEELRAAHKKLQEYTLQAEDLAVAEERNRLAREMHDTLGHRLTVAAVQLEAAQRLISNEPERATEIIHTVRDQVREALQELRQTVAALREPLEADLSLPRALLRLATSFEQATNIQVEMKFVSHLPNLPHTHRLAFYRAAQEALTNIQRHAQASRLTLHLEEAGESIRLRVVDDGVGIPAEAESKGFGLRGLQERAQRLGGRLRYGQNPTGGTELALIIPVPGEETNA